MRYLPGRETRILILCQYAVKVHTAADMWNTVAILYVHMVRYTNCPRPMLYCAEITNP